MFLLRNTDVLLGVFLNSQKPSVYLVFRRKADKENNEVFRHSLLAETKYFQTRFQYNHLESLNFESFY